MVILLTTYGIMDTMNTWREELAWAAGFFDGEGCSRSKSKKYSVMTINQIDTEVLERFHKAVLGLGKIYGPYIPSGITKAGEPRKQMWTWRVSNWIDCQAVYAMLYPFLGTIKRAQGAKVLANQPLSSPLKCRRGHLKSPTKWNQCRECMREYDRKRRPPGTKR
jgi:hypothetical protein